MAALCTALAGWIVVATVPQGTICRAENPGPFVVSLQATGTFAAPLWAVREVVLDPVRHLGRGSLTKQEVVLAEDCAGEGRAIAACRRVWLHQRHEATMLDAREATIVVERTESDAGRGIPFQLHWSLAAGVGPPPSRGAVAVRASEGGWRLAANGDRTEFVHTVSLDPGGSVPSWVVRWGQEGDMPRLLEAVEKAASRLARESRRRQGSETVPASSATVDSPTGR